MRHFFVGRDLADLEHFEEDLERAGLARSQTHLLTLDFAGASRHRHLNLVPALMQLSLVRWGIVGAGVGICVSGLVLAVAHAAGWTQSAAGWLPFIFLAIIVFGFSTWEGGFLGIQTPSPDVRRFEGAMKAGRHVFFVDVEATQAAILARCVANHPAIEPAGTGDGGSAWIVSLKRWFDAPLPDSASEAEPREEGGVALDRHQTHQEHEQPRR
jgi:hypothetical protein